MSEMLWFERMGQNFTPDFKNKGAKTLLLPNRINSLCFEASMKTNK
jgi:hypothetical protein